MVGVPRSHGCMLCVRRRVRCDEGRPGCTKCATYGADCPGYDRSLKFVTGKHQVRKRGQASEAASHAGHSSSISSSSGAGASGAASDSVSQALSVHRDNGIIVPLPEPFVFVSSSMSTPVSTSTSIPAHPRACRAAYVSTILDMINMDRPHKEALFYGSWFDQVPARLGRKVTLDSAVCSFAMHLLGKSRGDDNLVVQSRQLYGQSLVALQAALNHPVEWRSSETLCTTMVMCLFEVILRAMHPFFLVCYSLS